MHSRQIQIFFPSLAFLRGHKLQTIGLGSTLVILALHREPHSTKACHMGYLFQTTKKPLQLYYTTIRIKIFLFTEKKNHYSHHCIQKRVVCGCVYVCACKCKN